jgi:hypothetical protein
MSGKTVERLRVIILGASGMVGAAVLDTCLNDERVEAILSLGRSSCGRQHPKLKEVLHANLNDLGPVEAQLKGYNACFYILGVSSVGMSEEAYTKISVDLTLSVAGTLLRLNPDMAITYVSGVGTDETEKGKVMWARVKGRTENALLAMPFRAAVMFRLGGLMPLKGYKFKKFSYKILFVSLWPLFRLMLWLAPSSIATPWTFGRTMIAAGLGLIDKPRVEPKDFYEIGR